jgi:hypothetical protein
LMTLGIKILSKTLVNWIWHHIKMEFLFLKWDLVAQTCLRLRGWSDPPASATSAGTSGATMPSSWILFLNEKWGGDTIFFYTVANCPNTIFPSKSYTKYSQYCCCRLSSIPFVSILPNSP